MAIQFDVEELIGKLDIIEKTQIPFAVNQALKRFGFLLKTRLLPDEMKDKFTAPGGEGSPVPFTLNSLLYEAKGMQLELNFKKTGRSNLSPARYLYSAFYGGSPTDTSLSKAIQGITDYYPTPLYRNLKSLGALTTGFDIRGSYASKVISGLERSFVRKARLSKDERIVAVPPGSRPKGGLRPGFAYRVKGSNFVSIFALSQAKPNLDPVLRYELFVERVAAERLPSLLSLSLQRALASR
jgi:hypothetical protein